MHLKLDSLQKLLDRTLVEEKLSRELKAEIGRVLGPVVVTEGKLSEVVAAANDRLAVLDRTGRTGTLVWEAKVTSLWLDHTDPEVRKFAARVVPERHLAKMIADRNPGVRAVVAGRIPLNAVREMIKRFPKDDQLRSIFRQRKLHEAGIAKPVVEPMGHDPVEDQKHLGDAVKTLEVPDLTEAWYREQAQRFMYDYGRSMENAWEERAVRRYCSSTRATSGVEIDEARLLKSIRGLIKEKEDMVLERDALQETLAWLDVQDEREMLDENAIPEFQETIDPVGDLVHGCLTSEQYLRAARRLFKVQESIMPLGIRKYRLGEGNARQTMVPCIGVLPHDEGFRSIDERALDIFCENWNRHQRQQGEPLCLQWSTHPSDVNRIGFTCSLR